MKNLAGLPESQALPYNGGVLTLKPLTEAHSFSPLKPYLMPTSAFFAVLRDAAKLAATAADDIASQGSKMMAATDDVVHMASKAAVKTAGVAGDDLAVGAGQLNGVSPSRELPALWAIVKGSAWNKLWLSAVLLVVSAIAPSLVSLALLLGGLYLAYEGAEALLEAWHPASDSATAETELTEEEKVKGAIRTDLVLSLEILVIALATIPAEASFAHKAGVLALVSVIMLLAVYGLIMAIIRLDDVGLALTRQENPVFKKVGLAMAKGAPWLLKLLTPIGMFAMLLVAGSILTHFLPANAVPPSIGWLVNVLTAVGVGLSLVGLHHACTFVWRKARGKA